MCVFKVDIFQEGHISDTLFQYFSVKINISYGNRIMMTVQSGEVMARFECPLLRHCSIKGAKIPEEQRLNRKGLSDKRSAVGFCLGSGLFGSYNSD